MNWTEADVLAHEARMRGEVAPAPPKKPATQSHRRGEMNKTEALYAELLEVEKQAQIIRDWMFESVTFHLADRCSYTPDFIVIHSDGLPEAVEVKACMADGRLLAKDDSIVKFKVARKLFPWIKWTLIGRLKDGTWSVRNV